MTSNLIGMTRPPVGYGPGSQPADIEDGEGLNYLPMPKDMQVYAPHVPDIADPHSVQNGLARLDALQGGLAAHAADCVAALQQKAAGTSVAPAAVIA